MHADDYDASMPGLPPTRSLSVNEQAVAQEAEATWASATFLGAPCPDCKPAHHLPSGTGWFCDCGTFDPHAVQDGRIDLSPVEQQAIENTLAYEQYVESIAPDNVNLPKHYARFKIEPIRFVTENGVDFMSGNVIKYVMRHDAKNGREDLLKAQRYLTMLIKFKDGDPDWWKAET